MIQHDDRPAIERLLRPRSIAIAGVSATPGTLGGIVLDNLERFAFAGDIHLVHPRETALRGRTCVASVAALPMGVDCAVLIIPVAAVVSAVRDCAARGVGGVVIFSAGFAELDEEGRARQDEVARIAADAGMVIEGPNCLGYVNYVDGIPLTFAITEPNPIVDRGIAIVSQSGAMASVLRAAFHGRALPVCWSISTGNEAANGLEDFLAFALDDPTTGVAVVVAEHVRAPMRLLALADHAADRGIPLVVLHSGRSGAARAAAATHTGALAGDFAVMRAQIERHGGLLVETLEEMIDVCELLTRCPARPAMAPVARGVAVLGESGAFKALTLDYADAIGLDLPQPEGAAADALNAIAPGFVVASNPLDLTAQALTNPELWGHSITQLIAHPEVGALVVCVNITSVAMARRKLPPVIAAMQAVAPDCLVLFAMLGEDSPVPDELIVATRDAGVPFFRSPERAFRALARLMAWRAQPPIAVPPPPATPLPPGILPEHAAKDVLATAGLPMPVRRLAFTRDDAIAAAAVIGGPVALKVQSAALPHKSDVGGVVLHLGDDHAVGDGWDRLHAAVTAAAPDAAIDGVLVEAMGPGGVEVILGARGDAGWGPVLLVGLGGVLAEAIADVQVIAADLPADAIADAIHRLQGAAVLGRFRGRPPRDVSAAAEVAEALGRFMLAHPEVTEVDINPLLLLAEGEGVLALDALIACE